MFMKKNKNKAPTSPKWHSGAGRHKHVQGRWLEYRWSQLVMGQGDRKHLQGETELMRQEARHNKNDVTQTNG